MNINSEENSNQHVEDLSSSENIPSEEGSFVDNKSQFCGHQYNNDQYYRIYEILIQSIPQLLESLNSNKKDFETTKLLFSESVNNWFNGLNSHAKEFISLNDLEKLKNDYLSKIKPLLE